MYYISENGDFPPQYFVLKQDEDGVLRPVFGPDPDFVDAERKLAELSGSDERARNDKGHVIADDESTPDINEAYVSGKAPAKKKKVGRPKKKASKK